MNLSGSVIRVFEYLNKENEIMLEVEGEESLVAYATSRLTDTQTEYGGVLEMPNIVLYTQDELQTAIEYILQGRKYILVEKKEIRNGTEFLIWRNELKCLMLT